MNLVPFFLAWARSLEGWLGSQNITLSVGESSPDVPKPSAWVTLVCGDRESELILWESGEAEFAHRRLDGEIVQEHHELTNMDDLERLLSRLLMSIT